MQPDDVVDPSEALPPHHDSADPIGEVVPIKPGVPTPTAGEPDEFGGHLIEPHDNVRSKPDTVIARLEARLPLGGMIKTDWGGPASQGILLFVIFSEVLVGGTWTLAGWAAGVSVEIMALIVIAIWFASDQNHKSDGK